jgi:hypothetical protein
MGFLNRLLSAILKSLSYIRNELNLLYYGTIPSDFDEMVTSAVSPKMDRPK